MPEYATSARAAKPRVKGIVTRDRLFHLLDEYREKPVTWISAPAGSGKTTLVASWLDARRLPCLWYQLDERDADAATFFSHLGGAAQKVYPQKRKPLPLLTPEYLQGISTFTLRYFEELFLQLSLRRKGKWVIVFDNYQAVPVTAPLHTIITNGLSAVPEGISCAILSRSNPPPSFSLLKSRKAMEIIQWDDIRFTPAETREFASVYTGGCVPDSVVGQLDGSIDGWAAGLVLVFEHARKENISVESIVTTCRENCFDYFTSEIFSRMNGEIREFLLKTAFFPFMDHMMAGKLTGSKQAYRILSQLVRNNFFVTRQAASADRKVSYENTFQYHALFREFLQSRAQDCFEQEATTALKREAALILRESGYIEHAASLFIETESLNELISLILENAIPMIQAGRCAALGEWIAALPEELLEKTPWLIYWKGICRRPYEVGECRSLLARAFTTFRKHDDMAGSLLSCAGILSTIFLERSTYSRMDEYVGWLDDALGDEMIFPSPEIEIQVVASMLNVLTFRMPHHRRGHRWISRAMKLIESDIDIEHRIMLTNELHIYYLYMGRHQEAILLVETLKSSINLQALSPMTGIQWYLTQAFQSHMMEGRGDESQRHSALGLEIAEKKGVHVFDFILLTIGAYGAITAGDLETVKKLSARMKTMLVPHHYFDMANYHCMLTWADLYSGSSVRALKNARLALEFMLKTEGPVPILIAHLGLSEALYETGDHQEADWHMAQARRIADGIPDFRWHILFLFPEAYRAFKRGDSQRGAQLLHDGLSLGKVQYYLNTLYWRPGVMSFLCSKAIEHGIEKEYVKELIATHSLEPPEERSEENWPYPVKIYTLGEFSIFKEGKRLCAAGKAQHKVVAFLKILIACGGTDVGREHITDMLWPEMEGDTAQSSFKFTLHSLRRLLGNEKYVLMREGKLSLNPAFCWIDARALQQWGDQAEKALHRTGGAFGGSKKKGDAEATAMKALSLYRGDFLAGDESLSCFILMRDCLRSIFLRLTEKLGAHYENDGLAERAASCYLRALETHPLHEDLYRKLMLCYEKCDMRAEAMATYRRCRTMLSRVLHLKLSAETETVYKRILTHTPAETLRS